ncbi:MAG: diaminopimelate decarboxylase [Oscillospiraceae bacterium]|jgi:diaminopimelate decarboxylase|nr:diaminopimelate decarboxylase [Oscillospiraceae bacterium]
MPTLNPFTTLTTETIIAARAREHTPFYLYDEALILAKCRAALAMPSAWGLRVRYAMKANSTRRILQIIDRAGLYIDASSFNEARRAVLAGILPEKIQLTSQEVPEGEERENLEHLMLSGLVYNVCSVRQLEKIAPFAAKHALDLSIRVHPGVGSGESASRNTGDKYSCFGVHKSDIPTANEIAQKHGIHFTQVHTHIGSGGDPEVWRRNIDVVLGIIGEHFPDATSVNFGGGLKEARLPGEIKANIDELGAYAKKQITAFFERTGRKLTAEIEPGTFIMANAGYIVTQVLDAKRTGADGFDFIIVDGGMDVCARPLLYGSRHPFYVVGPAGELRSSDFALPEGARDIVVSGRCCESGDCLTLAEGGHIETRAMTQPQIGDSFVVGGTGAYCAAMTPFNYNSHTQSAEWLVTQDGTLTQIRKRQELPQLVENEC